MAERRHLAQRGLNTQPWQILGQLRLRAPVADSRTRCASRALSVFVNIFIFWPFPAPCRFSLARQ